MDLQQQIDRLTIENVTMKKERDLLTAKHIESVQRFLHFETETDNLNQQCAALRTTILQLRTKNDQIEGECQRRQTLFAETATALTARTAELKVAHTKLDERDTTIATKNEQFESALKLADEKLHLARETLAKNEQSHDAVNDQLSAAQKEIKKLSADIVAFKAKDAANGELISNLQQVEQELLAGKIYSNHNRTCLETKIKQLEADQNEQSDKFNLALNDIEVENVKIITELKQTIEELTRDLDMLNDEKQTLTKQLNERQTHEFELSNQLRLLEQAMCDLNSEKTDVEHKMLAVERDSRASDDLIKQLTNLLDIEKNNVQLLREKEEINDCRATEMLAEISSLNANIKSEVEHGQSLQVAYDQLVGERDTLIGLQSKYINDLAISEAKYKEEMDARSGTISNLEQKAATLQTELTNKAEEIRFLEQSMVVVQLQLTEAQTKAAQQQTELIDKSEEISSLEQSLVVVHRQLTESQTKEAQQQTVIADRAEQHREIVFNMEKLLSHCDELEGENKLLLEKCDKLRDAVTEECAKFVENKNRCGLLEQQLVDLTLNIVEPLRLELVAAKSENKSMVDQLKAESEQHQETREKINQMQKESIEILHKHQELECILEKKILNLETNVADLETAKQAESEEFERKKLDFEEQLRLATKTVCDQEAKLSSTTEMFEQLRTSSAQATNDAKRTQDELKLKNSVADDNLVELSNELAEAKQALTECQQQLVVVLEVLERERELSADQIEALQTDIKDKNRELETLKPMYDELRKQNESQGTAAEDRDRQIQNIIREKTELEQRLIALTASTTDVNTLLENARKRNVALAAERDRFSVSLQQLQDDYKLAGIANSQQLTQLQSECDRCESNLAEIKAENGRLIQTNAALIETERTATADRSVAAEKMSEFSKRIRALEQEKDELARDVQVAMQYRERVELLEAEKETEKHQKQCVDSDAMIKLRDEYARCQAGLLSMNVMLTRYFDDVKPDPDNAGDDDPLATVTKQIERLQLRDRVNDDKLEQEIVQLKENCESVTESLERLTTEYAALRTGKDDELAKLRMELSVANSERTISMAGVERECDQLRTELAASKAESDKWKESVTAIDAENQQSVAILRAKLMKTREQTDEWQKKCSQYENDVQRAEARVTETRIELEGKLEKMKGKMVSRCICSCYGLLRSSSWWWWWWWPCIWSVAAMTTATLFVWARRLGR